MKDVQNIFVFLQAYFKSIFRVQVNICFRRIIEKKIVKLAQTQRRRFPALILIVLKLAL